MKIQLENYFKVVNQRRRNFGTPYHVPSSVQLTVGLKRLDPKRLYLASAGRPNTKRCTRLQTALGKNVESSSLITTTRTWGGRDFPQGHPPTYLPLGRHRRLCCLISCTAQRVLLQLSRTRHRPSEMFCNSNHRALRQALALVGGMGLDLVVPSSILEAASMPATMYESFHIF